MIGAKARPALRCLGVRAAAPRRAASTSTRAAWPLRSSFGALGVATVASGVVIWVREELEQRRLRLIDHLVENRPLHEIRSISMHRRAPLAGNSGELQLQK